MITEDCDLDILADVISEGVKVLFWEIDHPGIAVPGDLIDYHMLPGFHALSMATSRASIRVVRAVWASDSSSGFTS